jgi:hypothetical protein
MPKKYLDLIERVFWTFVQTAGGVIIASQGFGADVWKAAAVAGGLSVVKCLVAMNVGDRDSAAALPGG